jgi:hypothetical protein
MMGSLGPDEFPGTNVVKDEWEEADWWPVEPASYC